MLTVLGIGVLTHLLVTSVRARRRDLAILKSIGFTRGRVRATIGWQAVALAIAALAVGIPLGIAGGRRSWQGFAAYFGASTQVAVPSIAFVVIAAATLVVTIAIAALPALAAAHTRPATVLATE